VISPAASTLSVSQTRRLRALPRDRSRRRVEQDLTFAWEIVEGEGTSTVTFIPFSKEIAEIAESVLKSIGDGFYEAAKVISKNETTEETS
jgi:hypothetical protein